MRYCQKCDLKCRDCCVLTKRRFKHSFRPANWRLPARFPIRCLPEENGCRARTFPFDRARFCRNHVVRRSESHQGRHQQRAWAAAAFPVSLHRPAHATPNQQALLRSGFAGAMSASCTGLRGPEKACGIYLFRRSSDFSKSTPVRCVR